MNASRRRLTLPLVALLALALGVAVRPLHSASAQTPAAAPAVRLPGHVLGILSKARPLTRAAAAGNQVLTLTVGLNRDDVPGFNAFAQAVRDPHSPLFRHFATQAALTARFGPSRSDYDAVLSYLQQQGFTLVQGSNDRLTITVRGSRALVERTFALQINDYQLNGRTFYANDRNPAVPAALAPHMQAISGLANLARPKPRIVAAPPHAVRPRNAPAANPMAFAQAYDFGGVLTASGVPATGAGEAIGLLEFDNYADSDISAWLASLNLPQSMMNQLSRRNVLGGVSTPGAGQVEDDLDIDTVMGMAPAANYVVYIAPGDGSASFQDLFNAMLDDGTVNVISNSWGNCEYQDTYADLQNMDAILAAASAGGIPVFTAAGDFGLNCNLTGSIDPGYPEDAPDNIGVGGTTLSVDASGNYQSEMWWDSGADTSGAGAYGVSCCFSGGGAFPLPAYQQGFTTATTRSVPDVVANADPNTGLAICSGGSCNLVYGGTSLAAPEWAAGLALIEQVLGPVGNINPVLYAHAASSGFHPPSSMLPSMRGATNDFAHLGLGSFDLGNLLVALAGATPCSAATLSASPAAQATVGQGITLSATASGCPVPQYQFWILPPGGAWTVLQSWTSNPVFSFNSSGNTAGGYMFAVWVRGATSPAPYDAYATLSYTLAAPAPACTSGALQATPATTADVGQTVTLSASAATCANPTYQFWVLPPGGAWTVVQPYASSAGYVWNTTGQTPGAYMLAVWVRDQAATAAYETYALLNYALVSPCTAASLTAAPATSQTAGQAVTLSATASGCPTPQYEFWLLPPGGHWTVLQAYSSSASLTWTTPATAGSYAIAVWVRDQSSPAAYDAYAGPQSYTLR